MNGLTALTEGFRAGGVKKVFNFPGYKSHELFSRLGGKVTSVNEKVAFELAWGCSYGGERTLVALKNVGLNDAADAFLNSLLVGVNAGLVLVVFDDIEVEGSQSMQDSRHYIEFFGGLWLEPYNIEMAYKFACKSFEWSEKFRLPVVIRITNQLLRQEGTPKRLRVRRVPNLLKKRLARQFVVHPINSKYQRKTLTEKNKRVKTFVEGLYSYNSSWKSFHEAQILVGSAKVPLDKKNSQLCDVFNLVTYPLPEKLLKRFLFKRKRIGVFEHGDDYVSRKVRSLVGGVKKIESDTNTRIDHSSGYIVSQEYDKAFAALRKIKNVTIVGDLGGYTMDSLQTVNACLCFGASPSIAAGVQMCTKSPVFGLTGDAAYLHSGKNVTPEIIVRAVPAKIVIFCNGGSAGTGGQVIPGDLYYQPTGTKVYKLSYGETSIADFERTFSEMSKNNKFSVLYVIMQP